MATMTFQINDASTSSTNPAVWVTITENADGTLSFQITQEGGIVGDLRGLFFDVADESILSSLKVIAGSQDIRIGDDSIKDLGDGANMNGLLGGDKGYDIGIEIGTTGIGADDVRSYNFTLDSTARDLTLKDFSNVDFAVRLTSVGVLQGSRADSSKLLENTSAAIDLQGAQVTQDENSTTQGNLLQTVQLAGSETITGWSGGAIGQTIALESHGDIIGSIQLNADGSYVIDSSAADELSEGESIVYDLSYTARNQDEATSWSEDTATFRVVINGVNDGPEARDDSAATAENNQAATGSVLANDSDVDRLDTIAVNSWSGGALGDAGAITDGAGATFTMNADGSYALDASNAEALSEGETITQTFSYTLTDNHGATDTATIQVTVTGTNDGPEANDDDAGSVAENSILQGSVLGNDTDVDRLDVLSVTSVGGVDLDSSGSVTITLESGALVTMHADGTYSYDTNHAFDGLNDGETAADTFSYAISDGHGGTDVATVNLTITGSGSAVVNDGSDTGSTGGGEDQGSGGGAILDLFPTMLQNISNVVLYLDDGDNTTDILKVKLQPEGLAIKDVDELQIFDFIADHGELLGVNTQLVGISVHAGQEYPNLAGTDMTAQGEGSFYFLLDDEMPLVEAVGTRDGGQWSWDWSKDDVPLSQEALDVGIDYLLLGQQAQVVFNQFDQSSGDWNIA